MSAKKENDFVASFSKIYKKNFRLLLIIPALLFILSIFSIVHTISIDGTPIYRDVSLKGGLSVVYQIDSPISNNELSSQLSTLNPDYSFKVSELFNQGARTGFIIDTDMDEETMISSLENIFGTDVQIGDNYSSNFISPTLSSAFFKQSMMIIAISLFFMSAVVFLYFRQIVPSVAVIISVIFDLIVTVGVLDFFRVEISIAGIGALLMLIGYSVDTDVLLTNRLIKERGDNYFEKTHNAFVTGVLMTLTTLIAGVAALVLTNSEVIFQIALILVVGLIVDFISTWIQNTSILLHWLEKKNN